MTPTKDANPEYFSEAQEIVDALSRDLIAAEAETRAGSVSPNRVNSLFRSAHSLKGISGMFGLEEVSRLAHELESVLDGMRLGKVRLDADALDVLYGCVDRFGVLILAESGGEAGSDPTVDRLVSQLRLLAGGNAGAETVALAELVDLDAEVLSVLTEYEEHRLRENIRAGRELFVLRSVFELADFDVGLAEIDAAMDKLGEVITKLPSAKPGDANAIAFDIVVGSEAGHEQLLAAIANDRVEISPVQVRSSSGDSPLDQRKDPEPNADDAPGPESAPTLASVTRTVRVDIQRLDRLMNLVGELGLSRMAFQQISEVVRRQHGFAELAASLHQECRELERRLEELQAGIMEVRMVPLANLFERMVRVGRKVSRELGRQVRIQVRGAQTELDKLIVEDLADPLMHLVRNAIDHGIEPPEERRSSGKQEEGIVRLSAMARGNLVVVEVEDDGRGINLEETLRSAVARGLVTEDRVGELSRREVFNLLLLPGFSTRAEVSEYSGRGVGMDVVKTKIAELSGVVDIDSREGRGTTVTVTLPITLAIIPALIVRLANRTCAIPLNNVQETLALEPWQIETIEKHEVISVRGQTMPLVELSSVFGIESTEPAGVRYAVVAAVGQNAMALAVDDLVGQQDIVIKSLGKRLRQVPGIAGAAELGNQQIILVIDVVDLVEELSREGKALRESA